MIFFNYKLKNHYPQSTSLQYSFITDFLSLPAETIAKVTFSVNSRLNPAMARTISLCAISIISFLIFIEREVNLSQRYQTSSKNWRADSFNVMLQWWYVKTQRWRRGNERRRRENRWRRCDNRTQETPSAIIPESRRHEFRPRTPQTTRQCG